MPINTEQPNDQKDYCNYVILSMINAHKMYINHWTYIMFQCELQLWYVKHFTIEMNQNGNARSISDRMIAKSNFTNKAHESQEHFKWAGTKWAYKLKWEKSSSC